MELNYNYKNADTVGCITNNVDTSFGTIGIAYMLPLFVIGHVTAVTCITTLTTCRLNSPQYTTERARSLVHALLEISICGVPAQEWRFRALPLILRITTVHTKICAISAIFSI